MIALFWIALGFWLGGAACFLIWSPPPSRRDRLNLSKFSGSQGNARRSQPSGGLGDGAARESGTRVDVTPSLRARTEAPAPISSSPISEAVLPSVVLLLLFAIGCGDNSSAPPPDAGDPSCAAIGCVVATPTPAECAEHHVCYCEPTGRAERCDPSASVSYDAGAL